MPKPWSEGTDEILRNMEKSINSKWDYIDAQAIDKWLQEKFGEELLKPISIYD